MAVHYDTDRAIATITLDSPENRNALSSALVGAVTEHLAAARADESVRAVVLTHTGSTFCAGADLKEQSTEGGPAAGTRRMLTLLRALIDLPKPVIVSLDGHVRAGGIGVVGASDIAIAGPASTFAFTEVRLGLAPAIISLTTLTRMTDRAAARYYLTGETFDGASAAAAGLVSAAVDDPATEVATICDALRSCSPQGLAATKPLTTAAVLAAFDARAEQMQELSRRLFESDEAREGMTAFLQKRPPHWARSAAQQ
jgi:enoyl-CoA hydratase